MARTTNNQKSIQEPPITSGKKKSIKEVLSLNAEYALRNKELDIKNNTLQRINADLDNFVHTVSHDLLSPLFEIELSIQLLRKMGSPNDEIDDLYAVIKSSIKKFRSLIKEMAVIGKLENDGMVMEAVDIELLISDIEWSLQNKICLSKATIIRNLTVDNIFFSKKHLRTILLNLISNGIKFKGDTAPIINIHTIKNGEDIVLSVEDNGRGIPKEVHDHIFGMYCRLNQDIEGQGIGLYLVKKIVNAVNGNIIVESEVEKGTKFSIYLKTQSEQLKDLALYS